MDADSDSDSLEILEEHLVNTGETNDDQYYDDLEEDDETHGIYYLTFYPFYLFVTSPSILPFIFSVYFERIHSFP